MHPYITAMIEKGERDRAFMRGFWLGLRRAR
jgi:hypothetical protein